MPGITKIHENIVSRKFRAIQYEMYVGAQTPSMQGPTVRVVIYY